MKKILAFLLAASLLLSMSACGGSQAPSADTSETQAPTVQETAAQQASAADSTMDMTALYESYQSVLPAMFVMDPDTMLNFLGIDPADCVQVITAVSEDGLRADEIWLIEARDEAALERILDLADARRTAKEEETISYAPDQYQVVLKSQLITSGLYLAFLVSPDAEALQTEFLNAIP